MTSDTGRSRRALLGAMATAVGTFAGCAVPRAGDTTPGDDSDSEPTSPTATDAAGSWPTFRGDARNTGCALDASGPVSTPTEEWTVSTDAGVWSSPVVVDGRLYVGSMDGHLYAIDTATGDVDWTFETGGPVQTTPTVADGRVFLASFDKHVYCVDAASGREQWATETAGLVHSSPTVVDGRLYIGSGIINVQEVRAFLESSGLEQQGGGVYALDSGTGDVLWREFPERYVSSTPAVVDGAVYVCLADTGTGRPLTVSLDATDGSLQWDYQTENTVLTTPSVWDGSVYAASYDGLLFSLTADGGDEEWTFQSGSGDVRGSTAVCDGTVYFPVSGNSFGPAHNNPVLYAISLAGEEQWRHEIEGARQMGSSPLVTSDAVYIGTHYERGDGGIFALTPGGDRLWGRRLPEGEGVGSSPTAVDGTLYYGADDGRVYALS